MISSTPTDQLGPNACLKAAQYVRMSTEHQRYSNALRRLFADDNFLTLLRAEAMDTLPRPLAEQLDLVEA
jgi:DNA invertase Pin-like site-specific DNA recombinase